MTANPNNNFHNEILLGIALGILGAAYLFYLVAVK